MADQGIGWDIAEWLKSQIDKIPTMTDVENASYGMPIGGEAVRSGLRAASLVGAPIGAAGALLGTAMSEAETENAGSSDYLEAAKQGAKEGPRSAMDNINVLDVASLGAGALGGGLARGAKTAAKFGSLADAANLNKAAKVANLADLGLSGVDASLGAGQAAVGAREGNWEDVGMGLARVGGNLVGANASLKDLGEGRAVKSIIDELGLKDTQAVSASDASAPWEVFGSDGETVKTFATESEAAKFARANKMDYDQMGAGILDRETAPNKTGEFENKLGVVDTFGDADADLGKAGYLDMSNGRKWPKLRNLTATGPDGSVVRYTNTHDMQPVSRTGETFTLEFSESAAGKLKRMAKGAKVSGAENLVNNIASDPKTLEALGDLSIFIRQLDREAVESLSGRISNAQDVMLPAGTNPVIQYVGSGKFRGYNWGTDEFGNTFPIKSTTPTRKGGGGSPSFNNAYYLNPLKLARDADAKINNLLTGEMDDALLAKSLEGLSDDAQAYVMGVRAGEQRIPGLEEKFKAQQFMRDISYTALHESLGHARPDSLHEGGISSYHEAASTLKGKTTRWDPKQRSLVDIDEDIGDASMFDPAHNVVTSALNDPTQLVMAKATMNDPRAVSWYKAALAENIIEKIKKPSAGKTAGFQAHKAAADEFEVTVADEPSSTPPGDQGPPVPPSDQPFGPPMKPIADRIRDTVISNRQVNVVNEAKKAEINNLRGQALKKINDEMASGRMTAEEFLVERNRILSSEFGLTKTIQELPVTPQEQQMMIERIAQAAQDDNFIKANNISYWQKLRAGERLTEGELKSITDAITTKTTELQSDPTIMKFLKMGENLIGGSRAIMSSWDLSAAGRQALFASIMNPREARMAFKAQIDALKMTPKEFATFMDTLVDPNMNPMIDLANSSGLHISHKQGGLELGGREEHFINAAWAEKVPGVLRTEQAYIAYLNKMRVELFNKTAKQLMDSGIPIQGEYGDVTQAYKDAAYMVNALTGRGELSAIHMSPNAPAMKLAGFKSEIAPGAEAAKNMHRALTNVFFAPRFAASRYALLRDATTALVGGNLDPAVYKIYMKNVMGTVGVMGSLAAAVVASGAGTFNSDPGKKDFGVLRVGKVRYDIFGGLKPWAKLAATMESDHYHDSRGKLKEFGSFGGKTKQGEIGRFVQGKLSPPASLLMEAITGEDFMGNKSTAWQKAYSHFTPMILQTITEAIDEGEAEQLPLAVPAAVLGIGVNTYGSPKRRYQ